MFELELYRKYIFIYWVSERVEGSSNIYKNFYIYYYFWINLIVSSNLFIFLDFYVVGEYIFE